MRRGQDLASRLGWDAEGQAGHLPGSFEEFIFRTCATYGNVGYGYVSVHGSRLRAPYLPGEIHGNEPPHTPT
jgi:hypothetical protein